MKPQAADEKAASLLRSQTSTVQIRVMEKTPPPVRIISLGRVYRPDDADATHYPMFHQIEGLLVDRGVTMADLKSVLRLFASSFFQDDVHIRFRPSFFPFTEPSVEVDMSWQGGWIEMGGAGMVDPNVFRAVGYDPEEFTGFAFGLGIERVCMRRHNVTDIREFYKNDVRFLQQFSRVRSSSNLKSEIRKRNLEIRLPNPNPEPCHTFTFVILFHSYSFPFLFPIPSPMIVSWNWLKQYVPLTCRRGNSSSG